MEVAHVAAEKDAPSSSRVHDRRRGSSLDFGERHGAIQCLAEVTGQTLVDENAVHKVSDHVYAIMTFPNIAILVGDRATMVVDTGLGERNGASAMRAVQKLEKGPILYLTNTHFHPEHLSGEQAFPPNTVLIRSNVMQDRVG